MFRKAHKRGTAGKPLLIGRLMAHLPSSCPLLYPLYLAAQLDQVQEAYSSALLPKAFDGLRVVYLSDIHYGAFFQEDRLHDLVEKVHALSPDVILFGGDYAEDSLSAIAFWKMRPGFRARCGMAGVPGNHDRTMPESNLHLLTAAMAENGVCPLVNDAFLLEKDGKTLAVGGLDDPKNGWPDPEACAEKCAAADFTLLLSHSPDALPGIEKPFYQLALCGHTHGGQIALFGHALRSSSLYGSRYLSGWKKIGGADVLISNGVGTTLMPVRLGARPQIHLLVLRSLQK